ncbi:MAG: hypothetical protein ACRDOK_29095 [Streptosporangiaceae bacterium]
MRGKADWVRLNENLVIEVESMLRNGTVEGLARQRQQQQDRVVAPTRGREPGTRVDCQ